MSVAKAMSQWKCRCRLTEIFLLEAILRLKEKAVVCSKFNQFKGICLGFDYKKRQHGYTDQCVLWYDLF